MKGGGKGWTEALDNGNEEEWKERRREKRK